MCVPGDLPKQVKVKKLAKLKTLDTKPGKTQPKLPHTHFECCLHVSVIVTVLLVRRDVHGVQNISPQRQDPHQEAVEGKLIAQIKSKERKPERKLSLLWLQGIQRKRPSEVQSAILRRHLVELTQSFIIPLVRSPSCYISDL